MMYVEIEKNIMFIFTSFHIT